MAIYKSPGAKRRRRLLPMAGIGTVPVKAKVPRQYAPLVAAGLVLFEADSNSDLYRGGNDCG